MFCSRFSVAFLVIFVVKTPQRCIYLCTVFIFSMKTLQLTHKTVLICLSLVLLYVHKSLLFTRAVKRRAFLPTV